MYLLLYDLDHEVMLAVPLQGRAPQAMTTAAKPLRGWRWTRFVASAAWTSLWSSGWNPTLTKSMLTWTSSSSTWPPEPRMDWSSSPLLMNSWEGCRSSDINHCHHHRWMNGWGSLGQAQRQSLSSPASLHLVSRWEGCWCKDSYHCHHHRSMNGRGSLGQAQRQSLSSPASLHLVSRWEGCWCKDSYHCHHHRSMNGRGSLGQAQRQSLSSPASLHPVSRWEGCWCKGNYHCHHHRWMKLLHAQWGSSISIITEAQGSVAATQAWVFVSVTEYDLELVMLQNMNLTW